ncbi:MAG: DUF4193 domain-containing protein [Actinomycetota bacterium]|nr:DUF4193 domain-containing protein [Actinomycetota bacterium]
MPIDYDAPRTPVAGDGETDERMEEVRAVVGRTPVQRPDVEQDEVDFAESFELPGADLSGEFLEIAVEPQHGDEFVCNRCFLVHHESQLANADGMVCRDCA